MKFYADIILSGENFNPEFLIEKYGFFFREKNKKGDFNPRLKKNYKNGYGILTIENDYSEFVIDKLITQYELIHNIGENILGIENKQFDLSVEVLQNSFTLSTDKLKKISEYFKEINITFIKECSF